MRRLHYALIGLALVAVAPHALAANTQSEPERRSAQNGYTLEIRYGRTSADQDISPDAGPSARFLNSARRLDIAVAPRDHGHLATGDTVLVYRIDACSQAPVVQLDLKLTYSLAGGERALQTQVSLTPGR